MTNSLYQKYDDYTRENRLYYGISCRANELFPKDNSSTDGTSGSTQCRQLIETVFQNGRKDALFDIPFLSKYEGEGKHEHTVALFLLGLSLHEIFQDGINKIGNDITRTHGANAAIDFPYIWLLVCLYHDIASCIEDSKQYWDIINLGIENNPYQDNAIAYNLSQHLYASTRIKSYFNYRISEKKLDHGIIGGLLLYDRLYKNYKKKRKVYKEAEFIDECGLYYGPCLLKAYEVAADAIISHNIWKSGSADDDEKYTQFNLTELMRNNSHKINIDSSPLHFMLCLLDSIEPIKRFKKYDPSYPARKILDNISINSLDNSCGLSIQWSEVINNGQGFCDWQEHIESLSEWMDIETVYRNKENKYELRFVQFKYNEIFDVKNCFDTKGECNE